MKKTLSLKKRDSSPNGYRQKGFESTIPDKPQNYIQNIDLRYKIDEILDTLGYDLRMTAPSHSPGHLTHPEWGRRVLSMYGAKGQVLVYLQAALGALSEEEKKEKLAERNEQFIRGARKSKIFQTLLYEEVGKERFSELMDKVGINNPDLFSLNRDRLIDAND